MKILKRLLLICMLVSICPIFTACNKDKEEEIVDYASQIAGIYTGKLMYNNTVIEDVYVVTVVKVSASVVNVSAKFFGDDGSANFSIRNNNGQFILDNETEYNINITVMGKNMTISYLNTNNYMINYNGSRD